MMICALQLLGAAPDYPGRDGPVCRAGRKHIQAVRDAVPGEQPCLSLSLPPSFLFSVFPLSTVSANLPLLTHDGRRLPQVDFLSLMAWTLIHAGWMHALLAALNAHDWTMRYVTHFSADVFSLLNSVIYVHKAALELQREHARARSRANSDGGDIEAALAPFLYAVLGATGTCLFAVLLSTAPTSWAPLFPRWARLGLGEYAAALSVLLWVGVPHMGDLAALDHARLEVQGEALRPSAWPARRTFVVEFWRLPAEWVFLAVVPGAIVTVLFFFDHEISSIICASRSRYGVRKPGGFAWDVALLGVTTAVCGVVGVPPANGLLPQAPLHTESLLHYVDGDDDADGDDDGGAEASRGGDDDREWEEEEQQQQPARPAAASSPSSTPSTPTSSSSPPPSPAARTHEQRYSPLLQAASSSPSSPRRCSACSASRRRPSSQACSSSWRTSRCAPTRCSRASATSSRLPPRCRRSRGACPGAASTPSPSRSCSSRGSSSA